MNGRSLHLVLLACFRLISCSNAAPDPGKEALEALFGNIRQQSIPGSTTALIKRAREADPASKQPLEK